MNTRFRDCHDLALMSKLNMAQTSLGTVGIFSLCALAFLCDVKAAKILVVPLFGNSHYLLFRRIGEELGERAHKVTLLVSSAQLFQSSESIAIKDYKVPYKPGFVETYIVEKVMKKDPNQADKESGFQTLSSIAETQANFCRGLLNWEGLKDIKPDIIVGDSHFTCTGSLSDFLGVKLVLVCPSGLTHAMLPIFKSPSPLSYAPQPFSGLDDNMTFTERLTNVAAFLLANVIGRMFVFPALDRVRQEFKIKPDISTGESLGKAELLLVQSHFALDIPRPLTPATIMTGPILPKPAKSLPAELESFMASAGEHGVIVVSFGSMVSTLPSHTLNKLVSVLGKMKQKVLWKIKGSILNETNSNIKTADWIPQNDVLGHVQTRAFLSHLGHNSMYEAAYHGVPTVGFPMWSDQPENARLIQRAGMGLWVDINTVTLSELDSTVTQVISDPSFKSNAARVSRLIRDQRRTPLQLTADWIEFVLRHDGTPHLRVRAFDLPWYEEYLIDVFIFLVVLLMVVYFVIKFFCRCLCQICCRVKKGKEKSE